MLGRMHVESEEDIVQKDNRGLSKKVSLQLNLSWMEQVDVPENRLLAQD